MVPASFLIRSGPAFALGICFFAQRVYSESFGFFRAAHFLKQFESFAIFVGSKQRFDFLLAGLQLVDRLVYISRHRLESHAFGDFTFVIL